ncbi:amidohydrolase family protein [Sulfobacillus thermosulfidooxidans]|uniref:amidohydrolase family protein n=1 Tax=Sulfobacillus thermosulfidooxidans TaxID=28034 RepID=UPI0006B4D1B2|nr:amidohydrolase family protein [Sulfobacillus thermosulfidooxidans]
MSWMDGIPLWDHHCHALIDPSLAGDMELFAYALTEAPRSYPLKDIQQTVTYWQALSIAAQELGTRCDAKEIEMSLRQTDFGSYSRSLFHKAGYERLLIDTGFTPQGGWPLSELESVLAIPIMKILRLETTAQELLYQFADVRDWILAVKDRVKHARSQGYVGMKSIIAYRSGLEVYPVHSEDAQAAFAEMKKQGQTRLTDPRLLNYLLWELAPVFIEEALPLQFHTGLGDPDTNLYKGNPLLLRDFLETFIPQGLQVTLLHTYPYHREAGFLASVYPNVYFDVSLALPLAASGAKRIVAEALELAPATRVLFASDSHTRPESFYLSATLWKQGLEAYCDRITQDHHILPEVAERWMNLIAWENCRRVYQL